MFNFKRNRLTTSMVVICTIVVAILTFSFGVEANGGGSCLDTLILGECKSTLKDTTMTPQKCRCNVGKKAGKCVSNVCVCTHSTDDNLDNWCIPKSTSIPTTSIASSSSLIPVQDPSEATPQLKSNVVRRGKITRKCESVNFDEEKLVEPVEALSTLKEISSVRVGLEVEFNIENMLWSKANNVFGNYDVWTKPYGGKWFTEPSHVDKCGNWDGDIIYQTSNIKLTVDNAHQGEVALRKKKSSVEYESGEKFAHFSPEINPETEDDKKRKACKGIIEVQTDPISIADTSSISNARKDTKGIIDALINSCEKKGDAMLDWTSFSTTYNTGKEDGKMELPDTSKPKNAPKLKLNADYIYACPSSITKTNPVKDIQLNYDIPFEALGAGIGLMDFISTASYPHVDVVTAINGFMNKAVETYSTIRDLPKPALNALKGYMYFWAGTYFVAKGVAPILKGGKTLKNAFNPTPKFDMCETYLYLAQHYNLPKKRCLPCCSLWNGQANTMVCKFRK